MPANPAVLRLPSADPAPEASPSLLMGRAELARELSISTRSLDRLASSGRLPMPVRLGGAVRWRRADIAEWIEAGCPARPVKK